MNEHKTRLLFLLKHARVRERALVIECVLACDETILLGHTFILLAVKMFLKFLNHKVEWRKCDLALNDPSGLQEGFLPRINS